MNGDSSVDGGDVSILLEMVLAGDIPTNKQCRVLVIGNSFADDGLKYESELLSAAGINTEGLSVFMIYGFGASLKDYAEAINAEILPDKYRLRQMVGGFEEWQLDAKSLRDILSQEWDIITLQQLSSLAGNYTTYQPYLDELVAEIKATCPNKSVVLGWNLVWGVSPFPHVDFGLASWQNQVAACRQMLEATDYFSFVVPSGTAVQNARALGIDNDGHCLTRDEQHLCYGAGLYVAACAWWEAIIAPWSGVRIIGNPATHSISDYERSDSGNPSVPVTVGNKLVLQLCAKYAIDNPFELSTDSIISAMFPTD